MLFPYIYFVFSIKLLIFKLFELLNFELLNFELWTLESLNSWTFNSFNRLSTFASRKMLRLKIAIKWAQSHARMSYAER